MSYCKCGGWLGSGGVDSFSGRYCRCASPEVLPNATFTSAEINLTHPMWNKDVTIQNLESENSQLIEVVRELAKTMSLIAGPVEFYCEVGERNKQAAANEALTKHKEILKRYGVNN